MAMLQQQKRAAVREIQFSQPLIGDEERQAVASVLAGTTFVHGPKTEEFEQSFAAFTGAPHAVSVSSCTAAMHLAYLHLGLGPGDEVLVSAQTHVATAHAVEITGATPVFVDSDPATGNIDIRHLSDLVTPRTCAIAVVHYLGVPAAMPEIVAFAKEHDLFVIEDCALSIGASIDGAHTGLLGDAGCFSFYPVKHMTTLEGGMLITRDALLAERIRRRRAFGVDRTPSERTIPGTYDVPEMGLNYRMNEVQAAIGIEQVKKLPSFLAARHRNAAVLRESLAPLASLEVLPAGGEGVQESDYCVGVLLAENVVERKRQIVSYLKERGVGTSVYYPQPVPLLTYYREKYGFRDSDFPVAAAISRRMIALPVGPHLSPDDMGYICGALRDVLA